VDRYIPGYVFFGDGILQGYVGGNPSPNSSGDKGARDGTVPQSKRLTAYESPRWLGKSLRLVIDEDRGIVEIEKF